VDDVRAATVRQSINAVQGTRRRTLAAATMSCSARTKALALSSEHGPL
jgi:hypothetical protein